MSGQFKHISRAINILEALLSAKGPLYMHRSGWGCRSGGIYHKMCSQFEIYSDIRVYLSALRWFSSQNHPNVQKHPTKPSPFINEPFKLECISINKIEKKNTHIHTR